jgi:hypothetical protein
MTMIIGVNDPPRIALCSLYLLLMATTCFFRRVDLVAITGLGSFLGFLVLMAVYFRAETNYAPTVVGTPRSYLVIMGANLIVTAILFYFLALRMQRLSQDKD